jgi:hypothetical protein
MTTTPNVIRHFAVGGGDTIAMTPNNTASRSQHTTTMMLSPAYPSPPRAVSTAPNDTDGLLTLLAEADRLVLEALSKPTAGQASSALPTARRAFASADVGVLPPAVALPPEVRALEREVTRLMKYIDVQRERSAGERHMLEHDYRERIGREERLLRQECTDLIAAFVGKAEAAERRALNAEDRAAALEALPARIMELEADLESWKQRSDESERGWLGLLKEHDEAAATQQTKLEAELERALQQTETRREQLLKAEQTAVAASERIGALTLELSQLRDERRTYSVHTQTLDPLDTGLGLSGGESARCAHCDDLGGALMVEKERTARLSAVVERLQQALSQQVQGAEAEKRRADQAQQEVLDARRIISATKQIAEEAVGRIRRDYEERVVPSMRQSHREELELVTTELEAAHGRVTALLKKNRTLAEALAMAMPSSPAAALAD